MAELRIDYTDDILDTSENEKRKYNMETNEDGTVSFVDKTQYVNVGDALGSADINSICEKINENSKQLNGLNFYAMSESEFATVEEDTENGVYLLWEDE